MTEPPPSPPPLPPDASAAVAAAPAPAPIADLSPAACAEQLAQRFAAVFAPGVVRPLKLRIQADIQQRAPGVFSRKALSHFLHRHTTSNAYLRALVKAAQRVDLDGQDAGEIAAEHREAAAAELERRRTIHEARRAAERDAQRLAHAEQARARADRAALLRAHDASTLTRKNFCALKGIAETDLDALLSLARQEREAAPPQRTPAPPGGPRGPARERRPS